MRFPAFMFWPERYWLDTYDLSDAEHGRYLRVLILMWNTPRCRIPNDPAWIAAKTGRSVEAFENEVKPILLRFCKSDGNCWWQTKLLAEYERCERLSSRGRAGGKALANKKNSTSQMPARKPQQASAPTPTPTPTPTEQDSLFPNGNRPDGVDKPDPEAELFKRGREVLGKTAGGLINNLLKAQGGSIPRARAVIERASVADNPREMVGGSIRAARNGGGRGGNGFAALARRLMEDDDGDDADDGAEHAPAAVPRPA